MSVDRIVYPVRFGGMSERFKEPVLKTGDSREGAVSSNLTPSAIFPACGAIEYPVRFRHGEVLKLAEEAPLLRV